MYAVVQHRLLPRPNAISCDLMKSKLNEKNLKFIFYWTILHFATKFFWAGRFCSILLSVKQTNKEIKNITFLVEQTKAASYYVILLCQISIITNVMISNLIYNSEKYSLNCRITHVRIFRYKEGYRALKLPYWLQLFRQQHWIPLV